MAATEVKITIAAEQKKEEGCCCFSSQRQCLCCCCGGCCCLLITIGIIVGVLVAMFDRPEVRLKSATLADIRLTSSRASLVVDVDVLVKNPNSWPFFGTVEQLSADVWSLDKLAADGVGGAHYVGKGILPDPVEFKTESEVAFIVKTSVVVEADPSTAALLARLNRDCGPAAAPNQQGVKETKLRIKLSDAIASVANVKFDLSGMEIPIETLVPCTDQSTPSPTPSPPSPSIIR